MSDESLFREVDEDVRQEQYKKLWSQYGNIFIALCTLIVLGVAGYKGWQYWEKKEADAASEVFFKAVSEGDAGKTEDALKTLESITHTGYGQLARLREAGLLASSGQTEAAVKLYDSIAASTDTVATLRDLARVRAAYALVSTASPAELGARVGSYDADGNPWRFIAREILMLAALKASDTAAATTKASAIIADPLSPATQRQRAQIVIDLLSPGQAKP